MIRYTTSKKWLSDVDSEEEIPTLVHLAAKYGLKEMGAKLMDLPSACKACSIANKDHKQPAEIAEQHENYELATFFRNITDLVSLFHMSEILFVLK